MERKRKKEKIVQKSKDLLEGIIQSDLTLEDCKIMDVYLSRINTHDPESRTVRFTKHELEEMLGVVKINRKDLDLRMKHLQANSIFLEANESRPEMRLSFFSSTTYKKDEYGNEIIELKCSEEAKQYVFNLENIGYLRFALTSILTLRTMSSYLLFQYLVKNAFRQEWSEPLENMKKILRCDGSYDSFKEFNRYILKRAQNELREKADCEFQYTPVRTNRKVTAIRFSGVSFVHMPDKAEQKPSVESSENTEADTGYMIREKKEYPEGTELWKQVLWEYHFSDAQLEELWTHYCQIPKSDLPVDPHIPDDPDLQAYYYFKNIVSDLKVRSRNGEIKNTYRYLLAVVKADAGVTRLFD